MPHGNHGNKMTFAYKVWDVIKKIVEFFLSIFHINLSEKQKVGLFEFVKFGIVGVSNTVLSYVIYLIVLLSLQKMSLFPKTDYVIGNILAWLISVLWSFYWNRKIVFKATDNAEVPWLQALIKTYASYAFTGLVLNNILSIFWVETVGMNKIYAPIVNLLISVPINFILNKFWAFRKKDTH